MFQTNRGFFIGVFLVFVMGGSFWLMGQCVDPVENLDTNECFATIQAAIDDSDTVNGHTIFVQPGTYTEQVTIDKSIILEGYSRYSVKIEYDSSPGIVSVTADNVVIKNLGVYWTGGYGNFYSGITLSGDNCVVDNVMAVNARRNIYIYGSSGNTIKNCYISTVYENHEGVTILGSGNYVCNNVLTSSSDTNGYGVLIIGSTATSNHVQGNTIKYFQYGIYILYATGNDIYHNYFIDNDTHATAIWTTSPYNTWDDGGVQGGNYWGSCTDSDSDCNCDSDYYVDTYEVDYHPLACYNCN